MYGNLLEALRYVTHVFLSGVLFLAVLVLCAFMFLFCVFCCRLHDERGSGGDGSPVSALRPRGGTLHVLHQVSHHAALSSLLHTRSLHGGFFFSHRMQQLLYRSD